MISGHRVVFTALNEVEVQPVDFGSPGAGEVLIRTEKTLISTGTELAWLTGIRWETDADQHFPAGTGYSSVGRIIEVGEGVRDFRVGDRVVNWGAHATYAIQPVKQLCATPEAVDPEVATFGPLVATAMGGLRRGRLAFGESVAIVGAGLLGQITTLFCRLAGAWPLIVLDPAESRLPRAGQMGATHTLARTAEEAVESVLGWTRGRMVDVVIEVTGNPAAISGALKLARPFGRVVLLGSPRGSARMNLYEEAHLLCLEILGAHNSGHPKVELPQAPWTTNRHIELFLDWQATGIADVRPLITHRYPWRQSPDAFRMLLHDRSQALGVVLDWDEG